MSQVKKRECYIDCLKGAAILLVVIGHVFDGYLNAGIYSEYYSFMYTCYRIIYAFHMPLFFVISGYVFQMAYVANDQVKPGLKKQMLNLLILYFEFSILFGLFKIACGKFTNSDASFIDIALICIKTIAPYWYLYVLLYFYFIFSMKRVVHLSKYVLLGSAIILNLFSNYITHIIGDYFEIGRCLYHLPFFALGVLLRKDELRVLNKMPTAVACFMVSLVLMILFRDTSYGPYRAMIGCNFLIAFGCSLLIFQLFRSFFSNEEKVNVRFFSYLGRYSLEIYLIHCVFTAGNRVILPKLGVTNFWINISCNIVLSTAIPIIAAIICKKIKVHSLIFRPAYFLHNKNEKESNQNV